MNIVSQMGEFSGREAELYATIQSVIESGADFNESRSAVENFWKEVTRRFVDHKDDLTREEFVQLTGAEGDRLRVATEAFNILARRAAKLTDGLVYCPRCRTSYTHGSCKCASLWPMGQEVLPVLSRSQLVRLVKEHNLRDLAGVGEVKLRLIRDAVDGLQADS